jgi:hypothetical protein
MYLKETHFFECSLYVTYLTHFKKKQVAKLKCSFPVLILYFEIKEQHRHLKFSYQSPLIINVYSSLV